MQHKLFILMLLASLILSGCECIGGFGRDLQKAGNWIEHTSGTNQ